MHTREVLLKKAEQSQRSFEQLKKATGITETVPVTFCVNPHQKKHFLASCIENNVFLKKKEMLVDIRTEGVSKIFKDENVLQTSAQAAALALCQAIASDIASTREGSKIEDEVFCDVGLAGLQALRLYFTSTEDDDFTKARFESCFRSINAFNGIFHKYRTEDDRYFSYHVYYESQKEKMAAALDMSKPGSEYTLGTMKEDMEELAAKTKTYNSYDLEELSFDAGACACVLRDRDEWNETEVGKAVNAMPLVDVKKVGDAPKRNYGKADLSQGPLSGLKVIDLTHIIAGAACSRILAENGADVLLVRRLDLIEQEQSFPELDGWAGKRTIDLDLNKEEDLARLKELIKDADVVTYTYQKGVFDKFGLSEKDIHELNPSCIYASLNCFSDTVWGDRPGWAPLAEDITGLSARNGSKEKPVNLNGVPLDYIPGFILTVGVLDAINKSIKEGGSYTVTGSLTRAATWLHELTDLCETELTEELSSSVKEDVDFDVWKRPIVKNIESTLGEINFPTQPVVNTMKPDVSGNFSFSDKNTGWL